jgi:hypothetical protein
LLRPSTAGTTHLEKKMFSKKVLAILALLAVGGFGVPGLAQTTTQTAEQAEKMKKLEACVSECKAKAQTSCNKTCRVQLGCKEGRKNPC